MTTTTTTTTPTTPTIDAGLLDYATRPTPLDPEPRGKAGFVSLSRAVQFVVWVRRLHTSDVWVDERSYTVQSRSLDGVALYDLIMKFRAVFGDHGADSATAEEPAARVVTRGPWASLHSFPRCLCPDGKRRLATVTGEPDTMFSVPARVTVKGRTVSGFVMARTIDDGPEDWAFWPNKSGKNAAAFAAEE